MSKIISSLKENTQYVQMLQKQVLQKTGRVSLELKKVQVQSHVEPMTLRHIDTWAGHYGYHQALKDILFQPMESFLASEVGELPGFLKAATTLQEADTPEKWVQSLHAWVSTCRQWDTILTQTKESLEEKLKVTVEHVNQTFQNHQSLMAHWKAAPEGSEAKASWMHQSEECRLSLIYALGITARPDQKGMPELFEKNGRILESGQLVYQKEGFFWMTDQGTKHAIDLGQGTLSAYHQALTQKLPEWRSRCESYVISVVDQCNLGYAKGCHSNAVTQYSHPGFTPETILSWQKPVVWGIFQKTPGGTIAQETVTVYPPNKENLTVADWTETLQKAIAEKAEEKGYSKPSITWDKDRVVLTQEGEQRWMVVEGLEDRVWSQLGWGQCLSYSAHDPLTTVQTLLSHRQDCHTHLIARMPSGEGVVYVLEPGGLWNPENRPQQGVSLNPLLDLGASIMQELAYCETQASQAVKPLEETLERYQKRLGTQDAQISQLDEALNKQQMLFKLYALQKTLDQAFLEVL